MNKKEIEFHIESGDYFGTLATILDLMRQDVAIGGYKKTSEKLLIGVRDDLVYLQAHYVLRAKDPKSNIA
jgi:hypothetical protein